MSEKPALEDVNLILCALSKNYGYPIFPSELTVKVNEPPPADLGACIVKLPVLPERRVPSASKVTNLTSVTLLLPNPEKVNPFGSD
jgi:hypothetical protein